METKDVMSTTGYVIWMYGSVIYAESQKQRATTLSTTEAELVAASDCARMLRYIRRLLVEDFHIDLPPIPVGEDNQGRKLPFIRQLPLNMCALMRTVLI